MLRLLRLFNARFYFTSLLVLIALSTAEGYVLHKNKWNRCLLTWAFQDPFRLFATKHEFFLAKNVVEKAVQTWERDAGYLLRLVDVSPPFESHSKPTSQRLARIVHIDIFFAQYSHGDSESFDGQGGMVAHTAYPMHGVVHFDASEQWSIDGNEAAKSNKYVDLRYVALHELGHALGLRHSNQNKSVMNPYYSENAVGSLHLSKDDIEGLQEQYKHCKLRSSFRKPYLKNKTMRIL